MLILLSQVCWQPRAECFGAAAMVSSISNIYIGIGNTQIPNIGMFDLINFLITGIAYVPVAAGSPGPFERKIP